jgi:hypothetical protein
VFFQPVDEQTKAAVREAEEWICQVYDHRAYVQPQAPALPKQPPRMRPKVAQAFEESWDGAEARRLVLLR